MVGIESDNDGLGGERLGSVGSYHTAKLETFASFYIASLTI